MIAGISTCVLVLPNTNVCPSGCARATSAAPITPPPPPLFSITTVPSTGFIFSAHRRAASAALECAGFAPAPVSVQFNPDGTPTGTGNVTAMFMRGYIEVLFKTADTPLGLEFDAALAGHVGVHLAAFAVVDAAKAHQRV